MEGSQEVSYKWLQEEEGKALSSGLISLESGDKELKPEQTS